MAATIRDLNLPVEVLLVIAILLVYIISAHVIEVFKVQNYTSLKIAIYINKKKFKWLHESIVGVIMGLMIAFIIKYVRGPPPPPPLFFF